MTESCHTHTTCTLPHTAGAPLRVSVPSEIMGRRGHRAARGFTFSPSLKGVLPTCPPPAHTPRRQVPSSPHLPFSLPPSLLCCLSFPHSSCQLLFPQSPLSRTPQYIPAPSSSSMAGPGRLPPPPPRSPPTPSPSSAFLAVVSVHIYLVFIYKAGFFPWAGSQPCTEILKML